MRRGAVKTQNRGLKVKRKKNIIIPRFKNFKTSFLPTVLKIDLG